VFGNDALGAELAGMRKDGRAVTLQMLAVLDPRRRLGEQPFEPGALRSSSGRGRQSSPSIVTDAGCSRSTAALMRG
jgi:hypothetical protein